MRDSSVERYSLGIYKMKLSLPVVLLVPVVTLVYMQEIFREKDLGCCGLYNIFSCLLICLPHILTDIYLQVFSAWSLAGVCMKEPHVRFSEGFVWSLKYIFCLALATPCMIPEPTHQWPGSMRELVRNARSATTSWMCCLRICILPASLEDPYAC